MGALLITSDKRFGKLVYKAFISFSSNYFFLLFLFYNSKIFKFGIGCANKLANSTFKLFIYKNSKVEGTTINKLFIINNRRNII